MKAFRSHYMKKPALAFFFILILYSTIIGAFLNVLPPTVAASPDITVSLDPSLNSNNPGESFTININIADVENLYAWSLKIGWEVGLLTCTAAEEGLFLKQGGDTIFTSKIRTSYVDLACMLLVASEVDGGGILASTTFQVTDTGNCTLDLYGVTLLDSTLQPIDPWDEKNSSDDGYFYTTFPVAKEVSDAPYNEYFYTPNPYLTGHPIAGETLTFSASACYDPDDPYDPTPGGIVTYEWDFGDNTPVVTENDPITTHVYATNGSYTGNLTITDDDGETDVESFTAGVKLHDIAFINVTATPVEVKVGETISINVTISNEGSDAEYLNVTVYYDSEPIKTKLFQYVEVTKWGRNLRTVLPIGENHTMTWGTTTEFQPLTWNTTSVTPGMHTISANAYLVRQVNMKWEALPGVELDLTDNTFTDGQVAVGSHDIAVTSVTCSPTDVKVGESVSISVTVANYGDFLETFSVTTYYDNVPIETQSSISLGAKADKDLVFTYAFVGEGVYTIKAEASVVDGETDVANNVYVNGDVNVTRLFGAPVASFSYSTENPIVNEEVTFNSTSYDEDGDIVSWKWDFNNDGIIDATTENATWIYTETGDHVVTLTVFDNDNLNGSKQEIIAVYAPPTANFTYTPEEPFVNETVTFDASASTPNGGTIISYEWDFDYDGVTFNVDATGIEANHTYTEFGSHTVMLRVTDSEDLSDSVSELIEINASIPVANFTYSPSEDIMAGETVTFNATDSYDLDGSIENYEWDFGDGTTLNTTDSITTHVYVTPTMTGFNVTLEVIDNDGFISDPPASASLQKIKNAYDIALTEITLSSNVGTIGENLTISVTAKNEGGPLGSPLGGPNTFDVIAFYNDTQIGATQSVADLAAGAEEILTFIWDTAGLDPGIYTVKAIAETTQRELNATNNELTGGTVTLSARVTSTISTFAYPANVTVGASTTISGSIVPPRAGATVTISYRMVAETWSTLTTMTTNQNGNYQYDWEPTTAGTYEVKASWPGDENTMAAESDVKTVSAHAQGVLLVFVHPANVSVGESATINGTMSPAQAGAYVAIDYRRNGATSWNTIAVVITYATGYYEYIWTPRTGGTYELRASWLGNEITPAANSTTALTVNASMAFPLEVIMYAGAAIGVVIAVSVAIYFVRIRKPKP